MSFLQTLNQDLTAVADHTLTSLVRVSNGRGGHGAGVVWRAEGLIVTNAHVVAGAAVGHRGDGRLTVTLVDGRELPATVLAHDPRRDLAALRIAADGLTPIDIGDSRRLVAGDFVLALGFPWGVQGGATSGIVIGVGAQLPEADGRDWIAAGLHLRPGHSGGPLVDSRGQLVGINTMMNGPEVGVAIPVHVIVEFLHTALAHDAAPSAQAVPVV
jgi:serine protease Do